MAVSLSRRARMIDLLSIALVVAGVMGYVWTFVEMQALRDSVHDPTAPIFSGYNRFMRLMQLNYLALGIIAAGVVVGISAALYNRRRRGTPPAPPAPA